MTASVARTRLASASTILRGILSWIGVPILLTIVVVLLYTLVINRIEPDTMTYRMFFDSEGQTTKLTRYIVYHIEAVFISSILAILAAIPAGIVITREGFRDFASLILGVANIGQTVPSMAILGLSLAFLGLGLEWADRISWRFRLPIRF